MGFKDPAGKKEEVDMDTGVWLGMRRREHYHDHAFSRALVSFFRAEKASTITDFGCGGGHYIQDFRRAGLAVTGYDGNPHAQNLTDGRCAVANLAYPMDLEPTDWTMAIEVAEHVPVRHEHVMMTNIVSHALCGIILSWSNTIAGSGHVNLKSQEDVIKLMYQRYGLLYDQFATRRLKHEASFKWIKNNVQVFRRNLNAKRERRNDQRGSYPLKNGTCVAHD